MRNIYYINNIVDYYMSSLLRQLYMLSFKNFVQFYIEIIRTCNINLYSYSLFIYNLSLFLIHTKTAHVLFSIILFCMPCVLIIDLIIINIFLIFIFFFRKIQIQIK